MIIDFFIITALIAIVIGTYTDIKTREVPDWFNYSLIAIGIGLNLIYTIIYSDYSYILKGLTGLGVALALGCFMYYTGQWGGGDSKMIFGLGAMLGLGFPLLDDFFVKFLINMFFAGALYVTVWTIIEGIRNRKKIGRNFMKLMKDDKLRRLRYYSGGVVILGLAVIFFIDIPAGIKIIFAFMSVFLYSANYLVIVIKAIEEASMIKSVPPEKLTEGDWIVEEVKVGGKYITGPKELGIKKDQIKKLLKYKAEGKIKTVKVKYGILFIPSFLIAMIYTTIADDIVLFLFIR